MAGLMSSNVQTMVWIHEPRLPLTTHGMDASCSGAIILFVDNVRKKLVEMI